MNPDQLGIVRSFAILALIGCVLTVGACSSTSGTTTTQASTPSANTPSTNTPSTNTVTNREDLWPDVVGATASQHQDGSWTISATLSSPYDSPGRYADAWRVLTTDGQELGIRELSHDHAGEQPFTRSLSDIEIPDDVTVVVVEGRDQRSGWGGETYSLVLDR